MRDNAQNELYKIWMSIFYKDSGVKRFYFCNA